MNSSGKGGVEILEMNDQPVRHIRIICSERGLPPYGYSLYEVQVFGDDPDQNLALEGIATASSIESPEYLAQNAIDNNFTTRWASEHGGYPTIRLAGGQRIQERSTVDLCGFG